MKVIGLTGSFGTGKTFVASIFKSLGGKVLDADKEAHDVIKKGRRAYRRIIGTFGRGILNKNGIIERRKLADIVFARKENLVKLNRIVHPEVIKAIKRGIMDAREDIVIIDAPLLIEVNLMSMVDYLIVVKASWKNQIKRSLMCLYHQG